MVYKIQWINMHGEKVELVRHLAFRMADMDLVKYRDENVKHWHISSESVKYFRGRNLRICFFLFTFTLSKLFGPSHYSRFSASTCYEFIHVRQRVHVYFIPGNWYGRRKGGGDPQPRLQLIGDRLQLSDEENIGMQGMLGAFWQQHRSERDV